MTECFKGACALYSTPMRRLLKPLWFLLAVIFLVEAWLW
ncbi:MAG: hypothetical protein QOH67_1070, partial [Hyphomicrobiales bacterium]|nr:hypothetical protein [Hyphomicrobiales bacterium]